MEQSEEITFEVIMESGPLKKRVLVRSEQTTDGVPIYHCYLEGASISQLRQETSGEWTQLWGDLPADSVHQVGEAIANHLA